MHILCTTYKHMCDLYHVCSPHCSKYRFQRTSSYGNYWTIWFIVIRRKLGKKLFFLCNPYVYYFIFTWKQSKKILSTNFMIDRSMLKTSLELWHWTLQIDYVGYTSCVVIEYVLMSSSYVSSWAIAALTIERFLPNLIRNQSFLE